LQVFPATLAKTPLKTYVKYITKGFPMLLNDAPLPISQDGNALISEVTAQTFMKEVMQASLSMPVLLYFTAPWCGPCKQFSPLLEKLVMEAKGKLKLAKVNIDNEPAIAQQFGIQSVPMAYIFMQGQPVDGFSGALPESQLKSYLSRLLGDLFTDSSLEEQLVQAEAFIQSGEYESALALLGGIIETKPDETRAIASACECYIKLGNRELADQLLSQVPEPLQKDEHISRIRAMLQLAGNAHNVDVSGLLAKLELNPNDHATRYELAEAFLTQGRQEEAINELLKITEKDREWNEQAARKQLLTVFEALGFKHPLSSAGRRRLSSILFS